MVIYLRTYDPKILFLRDSDRFVNVPYFSKFGSHMKSFVHAVQGSATLSMAYAGALFADACLRGLEGEQGVEEYSFVESTVTEVPFFSSKVILGRKGLPLVVLADCKQAETN